MARHVDEEIERRVEALVGRGELAAEEARRLRGQLLAHSQRAQPSDAQIEGVVRRWGAPSGDDLARLAEEVEALAATLEDIGPAPEEG
jgi:polyhydroxyalkanoate synthesis regulator phasin